MTRGMDFKKVAVRPGFEPGQRPPKGLVLPLHHRTIRQKLASFSCSAKEILCSQRLVPGQKLRQFRTKFLPEVCVSLFLSTRRHPCSKLLPLFGINPVLLVRITILPSYQRYRLELDDLISTDNSNVLTFLGLLQQGREISARVRNPKSFHLF